MKFYDLHVHSAFSAGESSIEQLAAMAKQLGYSGICFEEYFEGKEQLKKLKKEISKAQKKVGIDILLGFEARSVKELRSLVEKRKMFDILLGHGGDLKLNRTACETPEVDILTHPSFSRYDCGINHIIARLAAKNNVAMEINFREILISTKKTRNQVLANMRDLVKICQKYKVPIVLCSGTISHWTLRDPMCMQSMAVQLGMRLDDAKSAITITPGRIVASAKKKSGKDWIMPGVRKVK